MAKKEVELIYLELVYYKFYNGSKTDKPIFYFKDINSGIPYKMLPMDLDALLDSSSIIDKRTSGVFKKCFRGGSETIQFVRKEL
jgi:hypothetical protein